MRAVVCLLIALIVFGLTPKPIGDSGGPIAYTFGDHLDNNESTYALYYHVPSVIAPDGDPLQVCNVQRVTFAGRTRPLTVPIDTSIPVCAAFVGALAGLTILALTSVLYCSGRKRLALEAKT